MQQALNNAFCGFLCDIARAGDSSMERYRCAIDTRTCRQGRVSETRDAIESGFGAVIISIRSELYLEEPLEVYFLRENGDVTTPVDVIGFYRKQSFFAFSNSTVKY